MTLNIELRRRSSQSLQDSGIMPLLGVVVA